MWLRSWIFRREIDPATIAPSAYSSSGPPSYHKSALRDIHSGGAFPERRLSWSPVALFRFSALTFNAHMIHYSNPWTRAVEGHPTVVVHGPLNLVCALDFCRDHAPQSPAEQITYRATAPIYAGEEYTIAAADTTSDGATTRW